MPFTPETLSEKPYNQCIKCEHIGIKCDGPNFLAMSHERFAEWCRLRKEHLGWTNAIIAEKSGMSLASVNRILSGTAEGMNTTTMQAITKILVNGSWGQYPCASLEPEQVIVYQESPELLARENRAQEECRRLKETFDQMRDDDRAKISHLKEQIEFLREQVRAKDVILKERADFLRAKDKLIYLFVGISVFLLIGILSILTFDLLTPSVGFFR